MTVSDFFQYVRREGKLLNAMKEEQKLNRSNIQYIKEMKSGTDEESIQLLTQIEEKASRRERDIVKQINHLVDLHKKGDKLIRLLNNPDYQAVMRERYMLCHSWQEVAANTYWSESQIYSMHRNALKEIEQKIGDSPIVNSVFNKCSKM